jgi:hypothetical protein
VEPTTPFWDPTPKKCFCSCFDLENLQSTPFCGRRCQFKKTDCKGQLKENPTLATCKCICPTGFKNPPNCDMVKGTWAYDGFTKFVDVFSLREGKLENASSKDYFPLQEGNIWKYDAYDSTGMEIVSQFMYAIVDTFTLDTLNTILIHDFNYFFFDTSGNITDTLIGMMLYDLPSDSNQVFNYSNSNGPFILHDFTYGDTIFSDPPDFTVVDSLGTVTSTAGTFDGCIWLRSQDSSGQVFAPNVGMIEAYAEGLKVLELTNYFIHCPFHIEIDTLGASDCNAKDGQIILHTYGDTSNISFSWDGPTAIANIANPSNLSVGYYTVSVTNGECTNIFDSIPVAGCVNLPVELVDFTAMPFDKNVVLKWSTNTEINNNYFQLEHSIDGKKFNPVHRIAGAGNSYKKLDYSYLHKQAVKGINFYRLKQVDFGGLYAYSDIVSVSIDQHQFSFFPNPAKNRIQLIGPFDNFEVRLMKFDGTFLKKKTINSGDYLDLSGIAAGMYMIQLEKEGVREVYPLVVSKY